MENNSIIPTIEQKGGDASNYAIAVYGDMDAQKSVGTLGGNESNAIAYDIQKGQSMNGGSRKRKTNKSDKKKSKKSKKDMEKKGEKKGGSLRKKEKKESLRKNEKKEKKEKKEEKK